MSTSQRSCLPLSIARPCRARVEGNDALGRSRQIGHDKADARIEFTWVPFDLRHHAARCLPALCLIAEVGVVPPDLNGRTIDRAPEKMGDAFLKNLIGGEPDRASVVPSPVRPRTITAASQHHNYFGLPQKIGVIEPTDRLVLRPVSGHTNFAAC